MNLVTFWRTHCNNVISLLHFIIVHLKKKILKICKTIRRCNGLSFLSVRLKHLRVEIGFILGKKNWNCDRNQFWHHWQGKISFVLFWLNPFSQYHFCGSHLGFFRETGYETIFVFRENEGRVSQFRETAEIMKETSFAKHENRGYGENLKKKKCNYFSFNLSATNG